jgi:predicted DsbA family dithiol-disulfide isomerase
MEKIKISYWSDFVCPFCYIGEQRMKNVMKELNIFDKFEFQFLCFELDPSSPKQSKYNVIEGLAKKYNMSIERAKESINYTNKTGKGEGLDFRCDTAKHANTFNAHRLVKYIEKKGNYENTEKIINLLYDAYFTKNLLISDEKVLIELGMKAECTKEEIEKLLSSNICTKEVREDEEKGYIEGVHGVPYFIVDGTEVINGAVPKEEMKEILLKVLNKNNGCKNANSNSKGVYCDEKGCYIKKNKK